jgi:hypothetical protein
LSVAVPKDFHVHSSGTLKKVKGEASGEALFRAQQTAADGYPFVVAGKYSETEAGGEQQRIVLWSRSGTNAEILRQASQQMAKTAEVYRAIFGEPAEHHATFFVVECPAAAGCISRYRTSAVSLLDDGQADAPTAELASSDTVMVDPSAGAPRLAEAAAPSLAASWLGYARNPGFYAQTPPMSLLPVFAAAQSRERIEGPQARAAMVSRALRMIPRNPAPGKPTGARDEQQERAKNFLFFYGLQDRYGPEVFHNAISHMLYARAKRGFELDDLIAAFEQETHENVAQFVRLWLKHPDVPAEFRARYERSASYREIPPPAMSSAVNEFPSKGEIP